MLVFVKIGDIMGTGETKNKVVKSDVGVGKAESDKPKVVAVFRAECRATKGRGNTIAVVRGGSGTCRMYGKRTLGYAFPEQAATCNTLTDAADMAGYFGVKVYTGKAACDKAVADLGIEWSGKETVLADVGQGSTSGKRGRKGTNYQTF